MIVLDVIVFIPNRLMVQRFDLERTFENFIDKKNYFAIIKHFVFALTKKTLSIGV